GNHVDQAIRVYRGVARLLVPALDPGVPRGEFGRIRTERSASAGRQRTVERDGLRSLVRVNDTGHLAWLAHQVAMVSRYGHPIVRLEAQNLVTADPCHRQDGLRAADFDGLDGGDDRTVVARPFELRGAEGARYLYLDPVEPVLQPAITAGRRQDARIAAGGRCEGRRAQASGRRRKHGVQIDAALRLSFDRGPFHLPDALQPGRGIRAAERLLQQMRILDPGHLPQP